MAVGTILLGKGPVGRLEIVLPMVIIDARMMGKCLAKFLMASSCKVGMLVTKQR